MVSKEKKAASWKATIAPYVVVNSHNYKLMSVHHAASGGDGGAAETHPRDKWHLSIILLAKHHTESSANWAVKWQVY